MGLSGVCAALRQRWASHAPQGLLKTSTLLAGGAPRQWANWENWNDHEWSSDFEFRRRRRRCRCLLISWIAIDPIDLSPESEMVDCFLLPKECDTFLTEAHMLLFT